jgi:hypothetical protein
MKYLIMVIAMIANLTAQAQRTAWKLEHSIQDIIVSSELVFNVHPNLDPESNELSIWWNDFTGGEHETMPIIATSSETTKVDNSGDYIFTCWGTATRQLLGANCSDHQGQIGCLRQGDTITDYAARYEWCDGDISQWKFTKI